MMRQNTSTRTTAKSLADALNRTLYSHNSVDLRNSLIAKGNLVSRRYLPEAILPKWEAFLDDVGSSMKAKPV